MTRDIDLVVSIASEQIDLLTGMFDSEYYVDRQAVARAIAQRSMFNLIHNDTIIKLDCIVLKSDEYRQQEALTQKSGIPPTAVGGLLTSSLRVWFRSF